MSCYQHAQLWTAIFLVIWHVGGNKDCALALLDSSLTKLLGAHETFTSLKLARFPILSSVAMRLTFSLAWSNWWLLHEDARGALYNKFANGLSQDTFCANSFLIGHFGSFVRLSTNLCTYTLLFSPPRFVHCSTDYLVRYLVCFGKTQRRSCLDIGWRWSHSN